MKRQKLQKRLGELWRFFVISVSATGLWWVLVEHGWQIRSVQQVVFHNSAVENRDLLLQASGLELPISLLDVNTQAIETTLFEGEGPIAHAKVDRLMAPPRLFISLRHRTVYAIADRFDRDGRERGFLDAAGRWFSVPRHYRQPTPIPHDVVLVEGWSPERQDTAARLLSLLREVKTPVARVRFGADGKLTLVTSSALGEVELGDSNRLERKLAVLDHIYAHLASRGSGSQYELVDLRNPEQPELGLLTEQKPYFW